MTEQTEPGAAELLHLDESDDFGGRAARHLREDIVVWLTSVSPKGVPSPKPVWFVWDGASTIRVFSMPTATRLKHLAEHPQASLNFAGDGRGGDIVVLLGEAVADQQAPAANAVPDFVAKYAEEITRINHTPETFAQSYSVPIVITLHRVRGH